MSTTRRAIARRVEPVTERVMRGVRRGTRVIRWTPTGGLGFGNYLYLWLHAHIARTGGEDHRVLVRPRLAPWLEVLPLVRDQLSIAPGDVRMSDRRQPLAGGSAKFGVDFTREQLHRFIKEAILGTSLCTAPAYGDAIVVNVRRGDYYSHPPFRGKFGFDIVSYVELALERTHSVGEPFHRVVVVSDGVDWCQLKLDELLRAHARSVEYVSAAASPQEHFRLVATARRLIGTNSTFSYWGGYVSNVLYRDESLVVMPRFHARTVEGNAAFQLDPRWQVIEDIPGGWDA